MVNSIIKEKAIFVVGNSRTGTTMMGRILGSHSSVFTFSELHFFGRLYDPASERTKTVDAETLYAKLKCTQEESIFANCNDNSYLASCPSELSGMRLHYSAVYQAFLRNEVLLHDKTIPCEQTPRNVFFIQELLDLDEFQPKIINMIRDPRDVLLSQKGKWKRRFLGASDIPLFEAIRAWFNYHPITTSLIWRSTMQSYEKFALSDSVHKVKFEDLLGNPDKTVKGICVFLDIEFQDNMMNVPVKGSSNAKDVSQVGIDSTKIGIWRRGGLSRSEIYICEYLCREQIKKYGYEFSGSRPNPVLLFITCLVFPFKLIGAFVLSFKRFKNLTGLFIRKLKGA